ncbi:MAG TPA: hypothetical protein PKH10_04990 [bacterium]|nr:hypothetical protein [bacterium]
MVHRSFFFLFIALAAVTGRAVEDSTEAKLFHNEGYFTHEQVRQGHAEYDRTVAEMHTLRSSTGAAEFATAAKLITDLDRRMRNSNDLVQKLVAYYKQKWNQKHYQGMDKKWKEETYAKHKAKITSLQVLIQHLGAAYNDWNAARNSTVGLKDRKKTLSIFTRANGELSKALDGIAQTEAETFQALESELAAAKRMK